MGLLDIPNTIAVTVDQFVDSFGLTLDTGIDTFSAYTLTCPYDNVEYALQEYNIGTIKESQIVLTKYGLLILPGTAENTPTSVAIKLKYRGTEYTATIDLAEREIGGPMDITATKVQ